MLRSSLNILRQKSLRSEQTVFRTSPRAGNLFKHRTLKSNPTQFGLNLGFAPCFNFERLPFLSRSFCSETEGDDLPHVKGNGNEKYWVFRKALRGKKNLQECEDIFKKSVEDGLPADSFAWNVMLSLAFRKNSEAKVNEYLARLQKDGVPKDINIYNALLNGYCQKPERFEQVYEEMVSKGIEQTIATFTIRLRHAMFRRDDSEFEGLLEEIAAKRQGQDLPFQTYAVIIERAGHKRVKEQLEKLYSDLNGKGMLRKPSITSAFLEAFNRCNSYTETLEIYNEAIRKDYILSISSFEHALEAAAKNRDVSKMEEINYTIGSKKIFRTTGMHNSLIDGYQREGDFESAWKVYERLIKNPAQRCNNQTFSSILTAVGYNHRADKIPVILEHMITLGYSLTSQTYANLIKAYMMNGDKNKAVQALMDMKDKGLKWDIRHKNAIINSLKAGDFPESLTDVVSSLSLLRGREFSPEDQASLVKVVNHLRI